MDIEALIKPKSAQRGKPRGRPFQKGNPIGKKFGSGQPNTLGGRTKEMGQRLLDQLKMASETLGVHANDISKRIIEIALDRTLDPRVTFPFIKEAMLRIHGQPKSTFEEILKALVEKNNTQTEVMIGLSVKVKELAAVNDVKGVIAQLDAEGTLEPMLREIRGNNERILPG